MRDEEELNDENNIEVCLINVNDNLYEISANKQTETIFLIDPYGTFLEGKESLSFAQALWYHDILLNDGTIKSVPVFDMWIPRDEFIDIIDFHNIDK